MSHAVLIQRRAQKELSVLPLEVYAQVRDSIVALGREPRPAGCVKLKGREGWRIRSGAYRVIYEIDDRRREATILHVGHRKDVYR